VDTTLTRLIDDTLHGGRLTSHEGSCLGTNEAGQELASCELNIMAELESAIREIEKTLLRNPGGSSSLAGLEYVLGAYLVNAARHDAKRGVGFIESREASVMQHLLANIPVFFRKMDVGYNFGVEPPSEYIELAKTLKDSCNENLAATARRVLERLSKRSR
jgi:hypothetical protein